MDVTPLRTSRDFRLLFLAGTVFYLGGMVSYVAIPFQIYDLTGSNFAVGAIGLVELVPLVVFGLYGGALADHVDRRRLLVWTGVGQAVLTAVLAVNAFRDEPSIPVIFVRRRAADRDRRPAAAQPRGADAAHRPPRRDPRRQRADQLRDAARRPGRTGDRRPARRLRRHRLVLRRRRRPGSPWRPRSTSRCAATRTRSRPRRPACRAIGEGWSYAVRRKDLLGTYVVDIVCMLLAFPVVLFPALAADVFDHPQLLGLLYSAETVGALLATLLSGWTARVHHHGRAIVVAAAAYGLFIGLVGLAPTIGVALGLLVLAGAADMISGVFRGTVWNQTIPEQMRGRLAGIEMLSYSVGPIGGQVRAGLVADAWSVRGAIASGGFACVVGVGITAVALRDFWGYDDRTDEHAIAERELRAARGETVD